MSSKNNGYIKKGFTLIELLVVIAIIGLLSVIAAASFRNSQMKARDAQRKHDIEKIRTALELSFDANGYYPGDGGCANDVSNCQEHGQIYDWQPTSRIYLDLVPKYLKIFPIDPVNDATYYYIYEPNSYDQGTCNEPSWARACEFTLRVRLESGGNWYNDSWGVGIR